MEEPAVQQEKIEGLWEGGHDEGKADWKKDCSLSSILKHSCFLCWSSPRDTDVVETDERVLAKVAELRELENAVEVENMELQEQQSDRKELEETMVKLESHKEKLVQQIKATRQFCYEESQQILALQTEEVQKESQVEEYERELARARWRLRRLKEEVKQAKRKVEEAGERNTPLQDSIRQSYEEILQEENTLCSLSGSAVTPESQLEESLSPADTTEEDPLPLKPWGRSQSLPAYADLIMRASGSSFCNNLADTREELDNSGSNSTKMDRSDMEDNPQEGEIIKEGQQEKEECPKPLSQLDFYQANPFASCQSDHGFGSDPFKGSDPFAADILFQETNIGTHGNAGDEADTSLSCAENKASTGTQCFESEFPDEDSDIENSYIQEDQDVIGHSHGFKPIQSSSEELVPEPIQDWRSQGQYSVESDPNGYELDLGAISPPSDIEEQSLGYLAGEATPEAPSHLEQGLSSEPAQAISEKAPLKTDWTGEKEQSLSQGASSGYLEDWSSNMEKEIQIPTTTQNSHNLYIQPDLDQSRELSFDLSYEATSQSSFDPYGFKLSPEHSSHTLLDPDEAELSPEPSENYLAFDTEPSSSQTNLLNFNIGDFDIDMSQKVQDSDPYGFKLSPEDENQEILDLSEYGDHETMDPSTHEKVEPSSYCNQEVLESHVNENQEVIDQCGHNNQKDLYNNENQEVPESSYIDNNVIDSNDYKELLDHFSHDNQEVVEPYLKMSKEELLEPCNQEVLEPCSLGNKELCCPENQEVPDLDSDGNQELLDFDGKGNQEVLICGSHNNQEPMQHGSKENQELLDIGSHGNREVLESMSKEVLPEANNNKCFIEPELSVSPTNNSSDSDVATEDLLGLELSDTSMCTTNTDDTINMSAYHNLDTANAPTSHILEGDLGSVFRAGGYIGCQDVADDLEPLGRMQVNPVAEAVKPVRPVRPPRPSLKVKKKAQSQTQGIDLK